MLIIEHLKNKNNLTKSEQYLAEYILENPKSVVTLTSEELARLTFTSQSCVVRLCKKLNFKGFSDFKVKLASELNTFLIKDERVENNYPFTIDDAPSAIAQKLLQLNYQTLTDTFNNLDFEQLLRVAELFHSSNNISLYGVGASYILSEEFHYKLLRIGKTTYLENGNGFQITKCRTTPKSNDEIAFMISYYGVGESNLHIAKTLSQKKVPLILLTGPKPNPLCIYASEVIRINIPEAHSKMASFGSRIAMQFILDLLFSFIFSKDYEQYIKNITGNNMLRKLSAY